jgi:cation-transporting ATPase I
VGAGVSLAAAVPEGTPLLATGGGLLADHAKRARAQPRAIEALGRVDVVCADKTGTLTEGRIVLQVVSDGVDEADAVGDLT